MQLSQMEALAPMNLSAQLLHQRHLKCIITQNQKASTLALFQQFAKRKVYLQEKSAINSNRSRKRSNLKRKKKVCPFNSKNSPTAERNQKEFRQSATAKRRSESSVGFENIIVNNTTTTPSPTNVAEIHITKDIENCTVCFFYLETTGLSDDCEIVQVLVIDFDDLRLLDQYVYQMEA